MHPLVETLSARIEQLNKIISKAEADIIKAPEGSLRICKRKNTYQYYLRTSPQDTRGTYIKKQEEELIQKVAQRSYAEKVLAMANKEKSEIQPILNKCKSNEIQELYDKLSEPRKKLIHPYTISDEMYIRRWQEKTYETYYKPEEYNAIYTERGEAVRSKSEKILADRFNTMHIPYHYEKPLYLKGFGTIYPDFTVLNVRTRQESYWEHFGLMDRPEYCDKAIRKIEDMARNGIFQGKNLILTYETSQHSLNMKMVNALIEQYLI